MVASALALARGPRLGSPRPGRASTSRPRATFRGRKSPAKRTGAGASPRRARFAPSAALFHRGVSARGADEADAIALEILTRNGVGVLEVRRDRALERPGARTHEHPGAKSCQKEKSSSAHFCGTPKSRRISAELDAATSASLLLIGGDFFPPRPSSDILFLPFSAYAPLSSTRPFADALAHSPPTPRPPFARRSQHVARSLADAGYAIRSMRGEAHATDAELGYLRVVAAPVVDADAEDDRERPPAAAAAAEAPSDEPSNDPSNDLEPSDDPSGGFGVEVAIVDWDTGEIEALEALPPPPRSTRSRRCFPSAKTVCSKRKYEPTLRPTLPRPRTKAVLSSTPRSRRAR